MPLEVFPVFLLLRGRRVAVIGGGAVAERKVTDLLEASAVVRLVSPEVTPRLAELAAAERIEHRPRAFDASDIEDAWLVVACTDVPSVQHEVSRDCEARRIFCIAVDDVANASAVGGSILRRPPFVVAISSSGEAPALTRLVREILESALPPSSFIERARRLRRQWKERGVPMNQRFEELLRAFSAQHRNGEGPKGPGAT